MKKKVLFINDNDLISKRWNGYDYLKKINKNNYIANQIVINKKSKNKKVKTFFDKRNFFIINNIIHNFEQNILSIHSNLSLTSPALLNNQYYKDADILHFHLIHNTKLSLYSLLEFSKNKKIVISIHDPWFFTGRCVHPEECEKWKDGCVNCPKLNTLFPMKEDNCNELWKLKQKVYNNINAHIIVTTQFMYNFYKSSPLTKNLKIHLIPLGVDTNEFNTKISKKIARKKLKINNESIVLFLRAGNEFKGTNYVKEALEELNINKKITIITCGDINLLDDLKYKYDIVDLGIIDTKKLIYCYRACDIFLMPSIGESFGFMAVEAMSCEKPVIVFNNTALPYVTNAPDIGYLVENKNSHELKNAIEHLINNENERIERGKKGREYVKQNYNINKNIDKIMEVYDEIINEPFNKKQENKKYIEDNTKYIKYELNKLTKELIKKDSKFNELIYKDTKEKPKDYKIKYSDFAVQKIIDNYNKKMYEITNKCDMFLDSNEIQLLNYYNNISFIKKIYFLIYRYFNNKTELNLIIENKKYQKN